MKFWQFSKPKGPGFGISKNYYLSILAGKAVLPPVLDIVNPKGDGGAAEGFGAPLMASATKDDLGRPMQRGAYAIATKDRKTVLKAIVVPKEEAGFDPEAFLRSSQAAAIPDDMAARIRSTWTLIQLTFESHDPDVFPSLDFLQAVASRLGTLTEGVVADPISRRYQLPDQLRLSSRANPKIDVREHVVVGTVPGKDGVHVFTLGMQKFNLPEFEIYGVPDALHEEGKLFLLGVCQTILEGKTIQAGDTIGATSGDLEVRDGGLDRGMWEGIAVYELIPARGKTIQQALAG